MKKLILLLTFILISSNAFLQQIQVKDGKKFIVHEVVKGNTLYSVAREYKVNLSDILNNNPSAESGLKIGQTLYIPVIDEKDKVTPTHETVKTQTTPANPVDTTAIRLSQFHTVEKQETLYSISKKYGVTINELVKVNPGIESGVQIGQRLVIPDSKNQSGGTLSSKVIFYDTILPHTVESKETLYSISKRYMVSQNEIKAYNGLKNSILQPNSVIYIPLKKENVKEIPIREVPQVQLKEPISENEFIFKKKDNYQVILALPLGLNNPSERFKTVATEFYMGAAYALDSLRRQGLNADVYVIDCSVETEKYLNEINRYPNADLIIGPFTGELVDKTSEFSLKNKIPMINPMIGYGKPIESNPYLINAMTSDITLIKGLATFLNRHDSLKKVLLVKTSENDLPLYNAFRETLFSYDSENKIKFIETAISDIPTYLSKGLDYVIVFPSRKQNEVKNLMNVIQRNIGKVGSGSITVYGTKEWTNMNEVKDYYKNSFHLHFGMANDFTYADAKTIAFLKGIRGKYNTDLTKFMAQGFDVMYYFISDFLLNKNPENLLMNDFKLQQLGAETGKINTTTYIYEQRDFDYILLKKVK